MAESYIIKNFLIPNFFQLANGNELNQIRIYFAIKITVPIRPVDDLIIWPMTKLDHFVSQNKNY